MRVYSHTYTHVLARMHAHARTHLGSARICRLHKRGILPDVLHPAVPVPSEAHARTYLGSARICRLHKRGILPDVLHPAVPVPSEAQLHAAAASWRSELDDDLVRFIGDGPMLLSINRQVAVTSLQLSWRAAALCTCVRAHATSLQQCVLSLERLYNRGSRGEAALKPVNAFFYCWQLASGTCARTSTHVQSIHMHKHMRTNTHSRHARKLASAHAHVRTHSKHTYAAEQACTQVLAVIPD